jgi:hypothetical protein
MTEQSPKAELPTNEVELLNWIVDKVVEEGILPQEAAESSKESIQKIVRNNIEYFLHQLKVCNCYVCTCGQCRCNAPAFKPLYFSNLSRPVVQRDPNINISLNSDNYETLAYQHRVKQRSPDQYETSNQRTYKPFTAQLSPLPRYSPLPTMPFIARSNYQVDLWVILGQFHGLEDIIRINKDATTGRVPLRQKQGYSFGALISLSGKL